MKIYLYFLILLPNICYLTLLRELDFNYTIDTFALFDIKEKQNQDFNNIFNKIIIRKEIDLIVWINNYINLSNVNLFNQRQFETFISTYYNFQVKKDGMDKLKYKKFDNTNIIKQIGIFNSTEFENEIEKFKELNFNKTNHLLTKTTKQYITYSFKENEYKSVRFIFLDLVYSNLFSFSGISSKNFIEDDQWEWLESIFKNYNETLTFIGTSLPFLPFNNYFKKTWPTKERQRLIDLIIKYRKRGIIFLSSCNTIGQIYRTHCIIPGNHILILELKYHIYELTISGYEQNSIYHILNDFLAPTDYNLVYSVTNSNYGIVNIQWGNIEDGLTNTKVTVNLIDHDNIIRGEVDIDFNNEINQTNDYDDQFCYDKLNSKTKYLIDYFNYYKVTPRAVRLITVLLFGSIIFLLSIPLIIIVLLIKFIKKKFFNEIFIYK